MKWSLSLLLAAAACHPTSLSKLDHDADNPVVENTAGLWTTETDDEYVNLVQPLNWGAFDPALSAANYLPPTHPVTQRMQMWADRLDARLRQKFPGMLTNVPSPRIAVLQTDDINAYVTSMPTCFDNVAVRFAPGAAPAADMGAAYYEGQIADARDALKRLVCRHVTVGFTDLLTHVNHVNNTDKQCKLQVKDVGGGKYELTPGSGCLVDPVLAAAGAVASFVALPTAQHVTLFTGVLRSMTEEQMVAVMAHELGHYYHGHAYAPQGRYGYFYHLGADNQPQAPVASADLGALNADLFATQQQIAQLTMAVAATTASMPEAIFPAIAGQQLHTALFKPLYQLVTAAAGRQCQPDDKACPCNKVTSDAATALARFVGTDEGIAGPLAPDEAKAYLAFEAGALSCLAPMQIVAKPVAKTDPAHKTSFAAKDVFAVLSGNGYGLAAKYLRGTMPAGALNDYLKAATATLAAYPAYSSSAYAAMSGLKTTLVQQQGQLQAAQAKMKDFNDKAKALQLGYFSVEEEADDLSAEWLADLGFDAKIGGDADMVFEKGFEKKSESDKCIAARASQWKDASGAPIVIPWGPLDDPHPASCFRVRNYDKEAAAHAYPTPEVSPTAGLSPSWTDLIASIGGPLPLPAPPPEDNAPPAKSSARFFHCRFGPEN